VKVLQFIIESFNHYGYIVLLVALILELIAFPLPGEVLMTYCGFVIYTGKMSWAISILMAALGAIIGITFSYFIGSTLGISFFEKYGHYVHINKNRLDKISAWFEKYGNKLLIIAYFIPGVRHITGYFSGITKISYKKFAINAYLGAFIWTSTFISLGKIIGSNWEKYHLLLKNYLLIGSLIIAVIIIMIYLYRSHKQRIYKFILNTIDNSFRIFHSFGRIKALIATVSVLFLVFSALVIGIIQDYLAKEFSEFDEISRYILVHIFGERWEHTMKLFSNISNMYVLVAILIIAVIWIMIKGDNKALEIKFLSTTFLGASLLGAILKNLFHRLGPTGNLYTFPSSETIGSTVIYGFLAYLLIRHSKKNWVKSFITSVYLSICLLSGLSIVYFNIQYPSDVAAGYEFGLLWLCLSIIVLEVYRILPEIYNSKS
jgi:membrane protein DedA with SNARE-associated domain